MEIIREIKDENDFPVRRLTQGFVLSIYSDNAERDVQTKTNRQIEKIDVESRDAKQRQRRKRKKEMENRSQVEV